MATLVGQTVSHYKILEHLGSGGMGVVYKAQDTRLDRIVALKFLTEQSAATPADHERFIREARLAGSLNHPNIATIYEINAETSVAGTPAPVFIAMEFVGGKTLRELIDAGPLKIDEAIRIAVQIAEGLHAAHEMGVIHRDVKSGNIMVTPKGQVKIMDFGLAKLAQGRTVITSPGGTVGTAAYMSPEQVKGEDVDQRTDIWGLGVVFYEMITGTLPFRGDYSNAVVYAILNQSPEPLTAVRAGVPIALDGILAKMLAKAPAERYQHVEEIPVDLRNVQQQSGPKPAMGQPTHIPVRQSGRKWIWAAGGLAFGAVATAVLLTLFSIGGGRGGRQEAPEFLSIVLPDSLPLAPIGSAPLGIGQPAIAISKDGSLVAFVAKGPKESHICLRPLDRFEFIRLPGTEGGYYPFFSPDGRWIGFFSGNQLKKCSVSGGTVTTLCEAVNPRGASWAADDRIWFSDKEGARLSWVESSGGTPKELKSSQAKGFGRFQYPSLLPGDVGLLGDSRYNLKVVTLGDGREKELAIPGSSPRYLRNGYLAFCSGGSLMAVPFDIRRLEVTGSPQPVVDHVLGEAAHFTSHYAVSEDGTLIYVRGTTEVDSRLVLVSRNGSVTDLSFPPGLYGTFQVSPDGRQLVILKRVLGMDVWIYDLQQGTRRRVTTDGQNNWPIWSPDGNWILYSSGPGAGARTIREAADGSGRREVLKSVGEGSPYSMTPDGRCLAFAVADSTTGIDVKVVDLSSGKPPIVIAGTEATEWGPSFSRDGKYVAYVSDESGQYEIYVQPFPPDGRRWQISTEGGEEPVWSHSGEELFYRRGLKWIAVQVGTGEAFRAKKSSVAVSGMYVNPPGRSYDVLPDGRFLVLERLDVNTHLTEIRVVTNWFHDVEMRVKGR